MPLRAWTERLYHTWRGRPRRASFRNSRRTRPDTDFIRLGLTRLEDRVVLDGAAVVADLNPGTDSSTPAEQIEFGGSVYFSADGTDSGVQDVGRELYRLDSDGSVTLVADINSGAAILTLRIS